ncbi:MarR family transcriptional regulator [Microvirga sp. W0021]|uniref:MarR family transcriptional regulator n=1 Tax=Hohaiivirga grylli TaxID=3133970 RepID=A0ABV0BH45_9HYPH
MTNWVARLFAKVVDRQLKPHGLSSAHLPVMNALGDGSALSQKALVEIAAVEQPTMAATLARMERDNLVIRAPDPNDKRSSLFSLTEHGLEKFQNAQRVFLDINAQALIGLTETEKKQYLEMLLRVGKSLEKLAD